MNAIRVVFGFIGLFFLVVFWTTSVDFVLEEPGTRPIIWLFVIAPPLYGLVELFAYIIRVRGKS